MNSFIFTVAAFLDKYIPLPVRVKSEIKYLAYKYLGVIFDRTAAGRLPAQARKNPEENAYKSAPGFRSESGDTERVRLIAFYLPQYHAIPENDAWWGRGFTEWTNVVKAKPTFKGHYQPRIPSGLGYYDLKNADVRKAQANLAKKYGIYGFCYYHYWFTGKRLLNLPIDQVLASGEPDFPFCICWANENWTRRWDGLDSEILIRQNYSINDDLNFINSLIPFFRDARYIRIGGKPLLLVYKVDLFPDPIRTAMLWRERCIKEGVGDIYLACVQSRGFVDNPGEYGFDASVEFPPHGLSVPASPQRIHNNKFQGAIFDYVATSYSFMDREAPAFKLFRTVMPGWDNTARRQNEGHIFINSTPGAYESWLHEMIEWTEKNWSGDEKIVFINAWNEWGEGNYLEPDIKYGYGYLESTRKALGNDQP